jgi:four helix bundle protein
MPLATTFRELQVWQNAMSCAIAVFELSKRFPADERFSLTDQIRRSSRSVAANIAEAWRKRRYILAFQSKLNDAEAEAAETQTHLEMAHRIGYVLESEFKDIDARYEVILGQLCSMVDNAAKWCRKRDDRSPNA